MCSHVPLKGLGRHVWLAVEYEYLVISARLHGDGGLVSAVHTHNQAPLLGAKANKL
jgi:hypothetical protein